MEAGDLVRLPDPNAPALSPEKQQLALEWGGRHPYLLQLAGFWLWEARRQDRPESWAKQKFEEEAERFRISRTKFNLRRWWPPLRFLFWHLPLRVGKAAKLIGGKWDDIGSWIFGSVLLVSLGALALGKVPWEKVKEVIEKAIGG